MYFASAPAKVILFGEHAVVYGQPAIAVPVSSLRVIASLDIRNQETHSIQIKQFDQPLAQEIKLADVLETLEFAITLALKALDIPKLAGHITIESEIPIASGLGSGAAVATALMKIISMSVDRPFEKGTLNTLVYEVEKRHHGTPSGIDNTVVVYEEPVYFIQNTPPKAITIGTPFTLLIADSGKSALTKVAVGDVRKLYEREPSQIQPILAGIGKVTMDAREAIKRGSIDYLGRLMNQNHALLKELTVSSRELDKLVDTALSAGALGAKLSGGGRGGNMIALVTAENKVAVRDALLNAGAVNVLATTVG